MVTAKDDVMPRAALPQRGSRGVRTHSVETMGTLLCQGWKMLAESCDTCGVPLMQHPTEGYDLCVNCDRRSDQPQQQQPTPPHQSPAPPTTASSAPALAAAAANSTARAQERGRGAQQQQQQEEDEEVEVEEEAADGDEGAGQQQPAVVDADFRRRQAASDATSAALAERMLSGWALLDRYCPRCATPLVRSRQGQLFCVGCSCPVVDEAAEQRQRRQEADRQQQQQQQEEEGQQGAAAGAGAAAPVAARAAAVPAVATAAGAGAAGAASTYPATPAAMPAPAGGAVAVGGAVGDLQQHPTMQSLQQQLLRKINEAQQLLAATPCGQPEAAGRYVALLHALMDALAKARSL